jgi:dGTPase
MPTLEDRRQQWQRWLTDRRLGDAQDVQPTVGRSPFDRDHDRVVFSDAFRRMADKTQVWPLAEHDHTRTRLTHSLEVSCVGRSLGTMVGRQLAEQGLLPGALQPADVGTVVATACLAHDIGNPPFGHAGEQSVQRFFAKFFERAGAGFSAGERADLERFEGNAQGFRLLTRLIYRRPGGMRPTAAALGAMVKYPRESRRADALPRHKAYKKYGFFQQDLEQARETFAAFGEPLPVSVLAYARHPLAWLSEAADDICYMIIDLEDAVRLGVVTPGRARQALGAFLDGGARADDDLGALRARVIHELTMAAVTAFQANLDALEAGSFPIALVEATPLVAPYRALATFSYDHIYQDERVLQVESAGHEAIDGLLSMFVPAILDPGWRDDAYHARLVNLLPVEAFRIVFPSDPPGENPIRARALLMEALTSYQRLLVVTDYVSGLTDSGAVELYQKLKGVKLPR